MPDDKRAMHLVHVITIVSNDPESHLPEKMKEYYEASGITFGEFPLQPIGRAKNLMDEMPDTEDFLNNLPPENGPEEMPIATLIGDKYIKKGNKLGTLGYLKDLINKDKRI